MVISPESYLARYSEGFHGTSASRLDGILSNGFDCDDGVICFATPDNPEMAHEFGVYRASRDGDDEYAIIHANFPETLVELWPIPLQLRYPMQRAADIVIKNVLTYRISDNRIYLPS